MSIHTLIASLASSCTRYPSTFAAARERQPALAPFDGANALVDELRAGVAKSPQRYAIVNALMQEQERAKHPLWQALLVVAFAPMLRKTRADCPWKDDRDTDQIVLLAFLEAIASVRVEHAGAYMAIALYWVCATR